VLAFGDAVCTAGEVATGLLIVKSGSIRVFAAEGDKERSLGVRKKGEVVGEMSMLREYRHEWSARASGQGRAVGHPPCCHWPDTDRQRPQPVPSSPAAWPSVTAGGMINQLFDLKTQVDKSELEDLTRNVGSSGSEPERRF